MEAFDYSFLCLDAIALDGSKVDGCFGGTDGLTLLDLLVSAFFNTFRVAILGLLLAVCVGFVVGIARTWPNARIVPKLAAGFVEYFRNIPLLVQVMLWYAVLPRIFPVLITLDVGIYLVVAALGFFTAARIAEQVRAGLNAIPTGQRYAAQALGFTTLQTYRYVLFPRMIRTILPPLTSEAMGIVKNSTVAIAVSIGDMMAWYNQMAEDAPGSPLKVAMVVTLLYMLIALVVFAVMTFIQSYLTIPDNNSSTNSRGKNKKTTAVSAAPQVSEAV